MYSIFRALQWVCARTFQLWYTAQVQLICSWLSDRLEHSLHYYQCMCLAHIVKVGLRYTISIRCPDFLALYHLIIVSAETVFRFRVTRRHGR